MVIETSGSWLRSRKGKALDVGVEFQDAIA
jgi:hypothetical protein